MGGERGRARRPAEGEWLATAEDGGREEIALDGESGLERDGGPEEVDALDDRAHRLDADALVPALFRRDRAFAGFLVVVGVIGIVASAMLTIEYLHKLQDPGGQLLCDLNPFISCGPAMLSSAGHVLGIPNIIVGLVCWTIVLTTGMAMLAGARMRAWYWIGMQLGVTFGGLLITYLQWFSVFELSRLCLWCMIIWSATIPLAVAVTAWNLVRGHFGGAAQRFGRKVADFWWVVAVVWALCVVAVILVGMWPTIQLSMR